MAAIVLVHGAWHGPWCWEKVSRQLRSEGRRVIEVTLPGHERPGAKGRIWTRMSSFIRAVGDAVADAGVPVVLVGHSMGGYVAQRYLEDNDAAAAVLVASVPPQGTLRANLRAIKQDPITMIRAAVTADYSKVISDPHRVRHWFFTPETDQTMVEWTAERLQNESAPALNTMILRRIRTSRITTPVFVIGAAGDEIFTMAEQRGLGRAYGVEAVFRSGGHDLMLDSSWTQLAACIGDVAAGVDGPGQP